MKKILAFTVFFAVALTSWAQELKCNLVMNTSQVQGTNTEVFTSLESDLRQFINDTKWTDMTLREDEKIECIFSLVVNSYENGLMKCVLQVSASRPVYGTSYTTTLINVRDDKVNFHYEQFDRLEVNTSTYENNLTAIIAYYAYLVIGCDLDSYSKMGGSDLFSHAEQIVTSCQSKSDEDEAAGWKAFESKGDRNRYAIINNLKDSRFKELREYYYNYHRQALDNMAKNVDNGRAMIAEGLPMLRQLNRENPSAAIIQIFLDAKNDELINIFMKGTTEEKESAIDNLTAINPTMADRYEEIKTGGAKK
ncbi:MAG: DUF4835 family protein [Paludibacteraceae bacterium]|nr:DUF4835 family protein [Paludibacteraceae bacterium]